MWVRSSRVDIEHLTANAKVATVLCWNLWTQFRFGLVVAKTGSINSGTEFNPCTFRHCGKLRWKITHHRNTSRIKNQVPIYCTVHLQLKVFLFVKIISGDYDTLQGHPGCSGGGEGERDCQLYGEGQLLPPSPLRHVCRGEQTRLFFFSRNAWVPSLILQLRLPVVTLDITVQSVNASSRKL